MDVLPTGTVTFLFTDVEGSTRRWEDDPSGMRGLVADLDRLVAEVVHEAGGVLVKPRGEGDSHFCVFERATDAASAAVVAQARLGALGSGLPVRMAIHTGEADLRDGDYYGRTVNRAARLRAIGHGGQILLSAAAAQVIGGGIPDGTTLVDRGLHHLKDLDEPERVFELRTAEALTFPPLSSLDVARHNLPPQLTSFVGREEEQTEVVARLGQTRLVTLTGAGGSGKTRLAVQVAAEVLEEFENGAWMADLAPVADLDGVIPAVAAALGLTAGDEQETEREGAPDPGALRRRVLAYLRERTLLLLLDNCEHLIAECAEVTATILKTCPGVKVLATSREALGIHGETIWLVPSLGPDDAVRLFEERAALRRANQVTDADVEAVHRICEQLDGIPLAIELAAGKMAMLSAAQIAAKLDDRFRLLTGGGRTALARQQTLLATVDWSYGLLSDPERAVLRRLSVFHGGFTLDAAEAVAAFAPVPAGEAFELVSSLVEKSLIVRDPAADEARYRMLETIRQYGSTKLLDAEELSEVRDRHQGFYVALARRADTGMRGADDLAWLDRVETELDNFRAAIRWGGAGALSIVADLIRWWSTRGSPAEGLNWVLPLLESCASESVDPHVWSAAHACAGQLNFIIREERRPYFETAIEAVAGCEVHAGHWSVAASKAALAGMHPDGGAGAGAHALLLEALDEAERAGSTWVQSQMHLFLCSHRRMVHDLDGAARHLELADRVHPEKSATRMAVWHREAAMLALDAGDVDGAERHLDAADPQLRRIGGGVLHSVLLMRAHIAGERDDHEAALALFREAQDLADRGGHVPTRALAGNWAGYALAELGRWPEAREHLLAVRDRVRADGSLLSFTMVTHSLGELAFAAGDLADARRWLEEAEAHWVESGLVDPGVPVQDLGLVDLAEGKVGAAAERLGRALRERVAGPEALWRVPISLYGIAELAAAAGRPAEGARLAAAADDRFRALTFMQRLWLRHARPRALARTGDPLTPTPSMEEAVVEALALCADLAGPAEPDDLNPPTA